MAKPTADLMETVKEHKNLISTGLVLWGLSAVVSGAVTAYASTAFVMTNPALKAAPALLAPYVLNILGGVFNLLFGIVLVSLGRKIK